VSLALAGTELGPSYRPWSD